ncbi:MAG: pyridoxamine 5'-phosphate oxidase family protein [Candidatus Thorarchaeota archaeon]|nr:pyridoxamine 5'-phosphate oxidase family protein [Candidatus Thorarchaeota archaeon]
MESMTLEVRRGILEMLDSQRVCVLSTIGPKEPYSCLMSFDITRELNTIFFATKRARRKYRNIVHDSRVSLVVDNRDNDNFDLMGTKVVTVIGLATDYNGSEKTRYIHSLKKKHPYLSEFLEEDDTALITVKVEALYFIDNFESVRFFEF